MELRYQMTDILPLLSIPQPPHGKSSYNIPCPVCDQPGTKYGHLNINLKRNVFRCPKCGQFQGGVFDLYAYYMNVPREKVSDALQGEEVEHMSGKGQQSGEQRKRQPRLIEITQAKLAGIEARDHTYRTLLEKLSLDADHRENLLGRGLDEDEIQRLQYRSTLQTGFRAMARELAEEGCQLHGVPGFYQEEDGCWTMNIVRRGIMIPCRDRFGRIQRIHIRVDKEKRGKFRPLSSIDRLNGCATENWCHLAGPVRSNILLIEGYMKADIVHYFTGETVLAVPGVTALHHLAATLSELVALGVSHVMTCFDMDYLKNWHVESAYTNLLDLLGAQSLTFGTYLWPPEYNGLDDYIWEYWMNRGKPF